MEPTTVMCVECNLIGLPVRRLYFEVSSFNTKHALLENRFALHPGIIL